MKRIVRIKSSEISGWERKEKFEQFIMEKLKLKAPFQISYKDQDGDKIKCLNQQDFINAKQLLEENQWQNLLFQIQVIQREISLQEKSSLIVQNKSDTSQISQMTIKLTPIQQLCHTQFNNKADNRNQLFNLSKQYQIKQQKLNNFSEFNQSQAIKIQSIFSQEYKRSRKFQSSEFLVQNHQLKSSISIPQKELSGKYIEKKENNIQELTDSQQIKIHKILQNFVKKEEVRSLVQIQIKKSLMQCLSAFYRPLQKKQQMSISLQQVQLAGFFCDICERGLSVPFYMSEKQTICKYCEETFDSAVLLLKIRDENKAVEFLSGSALTIFQKSIFYNPQPKNR